MKGRGYSSESDLANRLKLCYTYDDLSRVTNRTAVSLDNNNNLISSESFNYNPAGNMTIGMDESVVYDTNNRIVEYQGTEVTYDADGNMLISPIGEFTYDSANRLTVADTTIYTYDVENIRVKKCIGESITEYTHNANSKLSQLLTKTENNVTTKYVYGLGLIGQEEDGVFKTYHYDYRGSTVALTNLQGGVTDTFQYDTYGKLTARTGTTATPFMYNGRDGVMTDENGLVYMRARYYSPTFKRFINADVVAGSITNSITLNRYAYANGNPVSNVDPFGLCSRDITVQDRYTDLDAYYEWHSNTNTDSLLEQLWLLLITPLDDTEAYKFTGYAITFAGYTTDVLNTFGQKSMENAIRNSSRPNNIGVGTWAKRVDAEIACIDKFFKNLGYGITSAFTVINTVMGIEENTQNGESTTEIISDAAIDVGAGAVSIATTVLLAKAGTAISPGWGTLIGIGVGLFYDLVIDPLLDATFE